jgi:lipopolysaccharide biosynthesis glycosyltransferase
MLCPIVFACDANYEMPLAVSLRSLTESNSRHWPISIFILEDGDHPIDKTRVERSLPSGSVTLTWITIDVEAYKSWRTLDHISAMTFARLLIGDVIPSDWERILYLDSDILVLRDLMDLSDTDLGNCVLAAVADGTLEPHRHSESPIGRHVRSVKRYFNAGVLVINLTLWKARLIGARAVEFLMTFPHTPYSDQDALNAVCDGDWKEMPSYWNFQDSYSKTFSTLEVEDRPAVVHFASPSKPWHPEVSTRSSKLHDSFRNRTEYRRPIEQVTSDFFCLWAVRLRRRVHFSWKLRDYSRGNP